MRDSFDFFLIIWISYALLFISFCACLNFLALRLFNILSAFKFYAMFLSIIFSMGSIVRIVLWWWSHVTLRNFVFNEFFFLLKTLLFFVLAVPIILLLILLLIHLSLISFLLCFLKRFLLSLRHHFNQIRPAFMIFRHVICINFFIVLAIDLILIVWLIFTWIVIQIILLWQLIFWWQMIVFRLILHLTYIVVKTILTQVLLVIISL